VFDRLFLPMLLSHAYKTRTVRKSRLFSGGEGCRKPSFNVRPGGPSRPCRAVIPVAYKSRLIAERFKPLKPQEEDRF
jgi:hypothetical protein